MSKFNQTTTRPAVASSIVTEATPTLTTHEGAAGYARDTKGELFLLAVSNMVGEDTFYEKAADRDARFARLVRTVAVADPAWTFGFLGWLRSEANMRSVPLVAAAEAVKARLEAGVNGEITSRSMVNAVLQRADEPGEMLAYWTSHYGRRIPKPIKRGVADGAVRLYNERSLLKYDSGAKGFRFGDVIDLVHPTPSAPWQGDLFRHALDRRHDRDNPIPESLQLLNLRTGMSGWPVEARRALMSTNGVDEVLRKAGWTWEALAGWLQGPMDGQAWQAVIPSMGYMALLRNLRNFDEAEVPDAVAASIASKLCDPAEVAKSRQLPFRFFSAYREVPSLRWGHALDGALTFATGNVPAFPGRTLALVDTSASMTTQGLSSRSKVTAAQAAALFGVCLAARGNTVDLVGFADGVFRHPVGKGASVLKEVERFVARTGEVGHGTEIARSLRATYSAHDRVIVISDMQTFRDYSGNVTTAVPAHVPMYGFNLGGYRTAAMPTGMGRRHEIGGLSDATFRMIPLLEAGHDARWPWEQ